MTLLIDEIPLYERIMPDRVLQGNFNPLCADSWPEVPGEPGVYAKVPNGSNLSAIDKRRFHQRGRGRPRGMRQN